MKQVVFAFLVLLSWFMPTQVMAASVKVEEITSPGGIKAWLVRDDKLPLIAMHFSFRGGVEQDPTDKQGLAELTAALLTQGAGSYNSESFQQQLADQSIQLEFNAGRDAITGAIKTLSATRDAAFKLLNLALTQPRFDLEALERARSQQLTAMKFELGDPDWQARHALFAAMFGDHPYGMRHFGTIATLNGITRNDIKDYATHVLARDNLFIGVAGNITPEDLAKILDDVFGALPAQAKTSPIADFVWPTDKTQILVPREGTQTGILFTAPAPSRDDPDWYAAQIVNYSLGGGGFSSRLMREVRDKEGLTYGISTQLAAMDHAAMIMGQAATDNAKAGAAKLLLTRVWRGVYRNGITEDEVAVAKDYLTGALPLQLTSTGAIAGVLVGMQLQQLGIDYLDRYKALIQQVKIEDIQRVIQKWFNPDKLMFAVVGMPVGIEPTQTQEQTRD